ncbi:hypothetical protein Tco_1045447 [Tanacetum coccineum]|uniref:Transposase n=1 Tax=Tanacetum coccineum TaxID=301880 RepID=A0ABQ5GSV3_9ASTR
MTYLALRCEHILDQQVTFGISESSYARAMIELRADEELKDTIIVAMPKLYPKKIVSDVVKNLNNPKQATRGVSVGPKVGFKSTKKIYRHVPNKNGASASGKKKQVEVFRQEVSNSNPFDVLNSIDNDDDLERYSRVHMRSIYKLERHILDGKLMPVDDDGKPLVPTGNVDSDSEVEVVFDETANLMASTTFKGGSDRGYGTNNLLEQ